MVSFGSPTKRGSKKLVEVQWRAQDIWEEAEVDEADGFDDFFCPLEELPVTSLSTLSYVSESPGFTHCFVSQPSTPIWNLAALLPWVPSARAVCVALPLPLLQIW